jgi:hypothetical protein
MAPSFIRKSYFGLSNHNFVYFYKNGIQSSKKIIIPKDRCEPYKGSVIIRANNSNPTPIFEILGSSGTFSTSLNNAEIYFDNKTQDAITLNVKAKNLSIGGGSDITSFVPSCGSSNSSFPDGQWIVCYSWDTIIPGTLQKPLPDNNSCLLLKYAGIRNVGVYDYSRNFASTLQDINNQKIFKDALFYEQIINSRILANNFPILIYNKILVSATDLGNETYSVSVGVFLSTVPNPGAHPVFGPWNNTDGGSGSIIVDKKDIFGSFLSINLSQIPIGVGNSIYGLGIYDFSNSQINLKFL